MAFQAAVIGLSASRISLRSIYGHKPFLLIPCILKGFVANQAIDLLLPHILLIIQIQLLKIFIKRDRMEEIFFFLSSHELVQVFHDFLHSTSGLFSSFLGILSSSCSY